MDRPTTASLVIPCFGFIATVLCSAGCSPTSGGSPADPMGTGGVPIATGGAPGSGGVPVTGTGGTGGQLFIPTDGGKMPGEACATGVYDSQLLPSNLLFVVDRSGSMNCNLPPITESAACEETPVRADVTAPSKWEVLTSALSSAFDALSSVSNAAAGLSFFSNDDACGVQSTPNVGLARLTDSQVAALKGALGATPRGGTPFIGATILGFKHLHQQVQARGNRFVVLVTDGADSCLERYAEQGVSGNPVEQLIDVELPKALQVNIRTFVIGAPGSEPARGLLSKIAYAGGTARSDDCDHGDDPAPGEECHFDMTRSSDFAADLAGALDRITGTTALACEFKVPEGDDVDRDSVNVDYYKAGGTTDADKVELYRDDTAPCDSGANGWQYIENETKIRLCGATCDDVIADPLARVIVSVGCEQRIVR